MLASLSPVPREFHRYPTEAQTLIDRRALTLIELIIVLTIIGVLTSLLLPAVQSVRERARETVCKNNLHQMLIAFERYSELQKKLPAPSTPGVVGGWQFDLMPFLEQSAYSDAARTGVQTSNASPSELVRLPIFTCPVRGALTPNNIQGFEIAHYVFAADASRKTAFFADAPMTLASPWVECPEVTYDDLLRSAGPHHGGLYFAPIFQGVNLMVNGEVLRD